MYFTQESDIIIVTLVVLHPVDDEETVMIKAISDCR